MPFPLVPAAIAAVAAGAAYVFLKPDTSHLRTTPIASTDPRTKPQTPPIQNQPGQPRTSPDPTSGAMPKPITITATVSGNPISVITPIDPDTNQPTLEGQLAVSGTAVLAAHALYDFLLFHGTAPGPELGVFVTAFQKAHNSDPKGVKVAGTLSETGTYDLPTSTALTVYTGHPVPSDPSVPNTPGSVGTAALTGSNLYAYLKVHPNSKTDATLKSLVLAFQKAANTDTKYPGPASPFPSTRLLTAKLSEDGLYGPKTSDALAIVCFERISPEGKITSTDPKPGAPYANPDIVSGTSAPQALLTYFQKNGNDKTAAFKALTAAYQTYANAHGETPKLVVDGLWGPKTQASLNKMAY